MATWEIVEVEKEADIRGYKDVVVEVHWRYGTEYGSVQIPTNNLGPGFTPFARLTEATIRQWTHTVLDSSLRHSNVSVIADKVDNPPIITRSKGRPWN
jgi:hypothetical protein